MTTALTQGLERIPDQLGYLVICDGAVLASAGDLENAEHTAGVISELVATACGFRLQRSPDPPFKRLSGEPWGGRRCLGGSYCGWAGGRGAGLGGRGWGAGAIGPVSQAFSCSQLPVSDPRGAVIQPLHPQGVSFPPPPRLNHYRNFPWGHAPRPPPIDPCGGEESHSIACEPLG
uniref:Ragulator complex protein LAMTOR4 n=1 Tax=Gopherus evgoodei TaxID=1825980 RepID=A0A8C4YJD8_9SAUR